MNIFITIHLKYIEYVIITKSFKLQLDDFNLTKALFEF